MSIELWECGEYKLKLVDNQFAIYLLNLDSIPTTSIKVAWYIDSLKKWAVKTPKGLKFIEWPNFRDIIEQIKELNTNGE